MKKFKMCIVLTMLSAVLINGCKGATPGTGVGGAAAESSTASAAADSADSESGKASPEAVTASAGIQFTATDMDGNEVSSDVFSQSKLTMVNVWATYCNPCLREMPGLGELAAEYDPEEFQLIGIISDVMEGGGTEMTDLAASLIKQTGADYPHLLLNESLYYSLLTNVTAVPTTFFVDENGVILGTVVGSMDKSVWKEKIDELLEK